MLNFEYTSSNRKQHQQQARNQPQQSAHRSDTDHRHDSYDATSSANLSHGGRDNYGAGRHAANHSNNRFFADDRSLSGQHRGGAGGAGGQQPHMNNFVMPPRYPQRGGPQTYSNQSNNMIYQQHQNGAQFPRGGTGDTGNDSFASSFKQQPHFYGGGPTNYSHIAAANSFHQNLAGDTSTGAQSVDYVMTHNNKNNNNNINNNSDWHHRGGHGSLSNTTTDWNVNQKNQHYEIGSNSDNTTVKTETRQNKWAIEFGKLDEKYMRDDSDHKIFSNQKHQPQMDRLEDDEQRSPERRPHKQIIVNPSSSPDRRRDEFFVQQQMSPERRETFGQVRPGSSGYQINMIGQTSNNSGNYGGVHSNLPYQKSREQNSQQQASTLSDILQKTRRSNPPFESTLTQSTNFHQGRGPGMSDHHELYPTKQTSAPQQKQQKSRKSRKTILDQKDHFKIRPARCYLGPDQPHVHYSQKTLTWQEAIGCIEDLGVDMSLHLEKYQPKQQAQTDISHSGLGGNFSKTIGYDFEDSNSNNERRQVARSDGFKNWNNKPSSQNNNNHNNNHPAYSKQESGNSSQLQTDFYQLGRAVAKDENSNSDDLASYVGKQKPQSLTQNNFFKSGSNQANGDRRFEDENVSNDDDSYHKRQELFQKNKDHIEQKSSYQQSKSPSGGLVSNSNHNKADDCQKPHQSEVITEHAQADAIQTLKNLRYSDLIYLLNILKLQRSKNAESLARNQANHTVTWEEAREQWVTDLQLALSVAVSAEERDSKDTSMIARVLIEKVEACRLDKFTTGVLSQAIDDKQDESDLKYEHFIGPLVILCAVNNLLRAQGNNTGDAECISTIKLCFDQFERYYAKAVSTVASQRRSNSMSGTIAFPQPRNDSFEVQSEPFKNFTVSLKTFIERENLPCKANLKQALESITLNKVQTNFLVFPQGSQQLITSQLNRLFGTNNQHERQQHYFAEPKISEPALQVKNKQQTAGHLYPASTSENLLLNSNLGQQTAANYSPRSTFSTAKKCVAHGITFCPCGGSAGNTDEQSNMNLTPARGSNKTTAAKPSSTLQPQFSQQQQQQQFNDDGLRHQQHQFPAERRQHSMVDFSASRRLKTQESGNNYVSNTTDMVTDYRPFSTIISGKSDNVEAESVRPSIYSHNKANEPMSLVLENKRSVPSQQSFSSKSVQKPKKGILKQSSSYLDSQSKPPNNNGGNFSKKQSSKQTMTTYARQTGQVQTHPSTTQPSPYMAMKKISKVSGKGGVGNPSPRGSSTSKKQQQQQSNLRYDSQKNLLHRLGGGSTSDEPPKFSHAHKINNNIAAPSTSGNIFSPKTTTTGLHSNASNRNNHTDFSNQGSARKASNSKRQQHQQQTVHTNAGASRQNSNHGHQINSLSQILRTPLTNSQSSTPQNGTRQAAMQRMSTQQYSSIGGYAASHPSNTDVSTQSMVPAHSTASGLVANSMKYLRTTTNASTASGQMGGGVQTNSTLSHHHQHQAPPSIGNYHKSGLLNTSAHSSNVLLQAQNMQNRNDSFGMQSNYSANQHVASSLHGIQGHHVTNDQHSSHNNNKISTLYRNNQQQQQQRPNAEQQFSNRMQSIISPQNQHLPKSTTSGQQQMRQNSSRDSFSQQQTQLNNRQPPSSPQRTSIHQSPQRTNSLNQHAQQMQTSSAARRSNSHQGPAAGGSGSQATSLLQTSLHTSNGTVFNQHQQQQQQHIMNSSGSGTGQAYHPHPRLINSARKQQSGSSHGPTAFSGVTHTDFNQVSQFSLSSLKDASAGNGGQRIQHGVSGGGNYGSQSANNPNRRRPPQSQY